jgi:hypothetical protein
VPFVSGENAAKIASMKATFIPAPASVTQLPDLSHPVGRVGDAPLYRRAGGRVHDRRQDETVGAPGEDRVPREADLQRRVAAGQSLDRCGLQACGIGPAANKSFDKTLS